MKTSLIIALTLISFNSFSSQLNCQVNQYGKGINKAIQIDLSQYFYDETGVKSAFISQIDGHEYNVKTNLASPGEFIISVQDMTKREIEAEITETSPAQKPTLIHTNNKVSISCIY